MPAVQAEHANALSQEPDSIPQPEGLVYMMTPIQLESSTEVTLHWVRFDES